MGLRNPLTAFIAVSNPEAYLVCNALQQAGIDAVVIEDHSQVGTWLWSLPQNHKPQLCIDRADIDRARLVLQEYERQSAERQGIIWGPASTGAMILEALERLGLHQ